MNELWCIHVEGPDDVHAAPSKEAAEIRAEYWNTQFAIPNERYKDDPNWLSIKTVAMIWPHSAKSHAASLAEEEWGTLPLQQAALDATRSK